MKITRKRLKQLIKEALEPSVQDKIRDMSKFEIETAIEELENYKEKPMTRRSFLFGAIGLGMIGALFGRSFLQDKSNRAELLAQLKTTQLGVTGDFGAGTVIDKSDLFNSMASKSPKIFSKYGFYSADDFVDFNSEEDVAEYVPKIREHARVLGCNFKDVAYIDLETLPGDLGHGTYYAIIQIMTRLNMQGKGQKVRFNYEPGVKAELYDTGSFKILYHEDSYGKFFAIAGR